MARPIRLEFLNALYHVLSRKNAGENIFVEDAMTDTFCTFFADIGGTKNQPHALISTKETPQLVIDQIRKLIKLLDEQIKAPRDAGLKLIQ